MTKQHLATFCGAILLCACSSNTGYNIVGTAASVVDGDTVYLGTYQGYLGFTPEDTAYVADGRFTFVGSIEGAALRFVVATHAGQPVGLANIVLENADIAIQIPAGEDAEAIVEGGPSQKVFSAFVESQDAIGRQLEAPWAAVCDTTNPEETRAAAQHIVDSLQTEAHNMQIDLLMEHAHEPVADMMLPYLMRTLTEEQLNVLLDKMEQGEHHYPFFREIKAQRDAEREAEATVAIGKQYTDLVMETPDGTEMKVSDYVSKNRYTLIDFWASWCGPCIAEMPILVEAYAKHHTSGFEIVGVSLDNNRDAWVGAIEKHGLSWPNMSDLKGWQSIGAARYNIRSIPANVLIDADGAIIDKNLRGEKLGESLDILFAK